MIISVNWLKQFTEIDGSIEDLAALIGARLVEVEEIIDVGAKYSGVYIADVKKVEPHPNADKLRVVYIDDGGAANVQRDEDGLVQVVCGAPNVRAGIKVAWVAPGAAVPATVDSAEPVVLAARELRGVVSNGMLASAKELGVGDEHGGILEVDKEVSPGSSFAATCELDDYLLDIENKSLTHRPDCFGLIGFAREVAAIQGKQFSTPTWLQALEPRLLPLAENTEPLQVLARIEADVSKRYELVAFDGVDATKQSPFAIQTWLVRVGIRPISAVVDITNYLMYLTGQPLHAFDLDAVIAEHPEQKLEIVVREARPGETLQLLDGRTIELENDIVICSGEKPIGLAGAMGGASTEITAKTTRVLLESATFDLFRLRTTQMRHAIYSEAITRFTKGQTPAQTAPVLASAARMLTDVAGARRISEIIDEYPGREAPAPIRLSIAYLNSLLGMEIPAEAAKEVLERVEMMVTEEAGDLLVTPPYWRADITLPEDVVEEIGRIYGFDEITPMLPHRSLKAVSPSHTDAVAARIRLALTRAGANELLTYSFVPEKLLTAANQNPARAFKITNALSRDLQYYRPSLTPSLLEKVHPNVKAGFECFALFELGKVHNKLHMNAEPGLPNELPTLALVYTNEKPKKAAGAAFYHARRLLDYLAKSLGCNLAYEQMKEESEDPLLQCPFNPARTARVTIKQTGESLGLVGEYSVSTRKKLKLPVHTAGFEVSLTALAKAADSIKPYTPLSRYPGTSRDVTLRVAEAVPFATLESCLQNTLESMLQTATLQTELESIGLYKNEKDAGHKHVTLRLHLTHHEQTITAEQANQVVAELTAAAAQQLSAQVV